MRSKKILITGCSSGGKTSLIDALDRRGFQTVPEPGRRIIAEERAIHGTALPWIDPAAFAQRAIQMALDDLASPADVNCVTFFDRGLIDAAVALDFAGGASYSALLGRELHYANPVFLVPPWPEIYEQDEDRQHGFTAAAAEYARLAEAVSTLGYDTCILPKVPVHDRVAAILARLGLQET
ncbi:MAG: AAA family ATPase [Pseudomonadota bacterium]